MPEARHSDSSPSATWAVMAMIGMRVFVLSLNFEFGASPQIHQVRASDNPLKSNLQTAAGTAQPLLDHSLLHLPDAQPF